MDWSSEDPRPLINKRDIIVVVRPSLDNKGRETRYAFMADVETKTGWSVLPWGTHHRAILEDDAWPTNWVWCRAPT